MAFVIIADRNENKDLASWKSWKNEHIKRPLARWKNSAMFKGEESGECTVGCRPGEG